MIHSKEITCPHCANKDLVKNGHSPSDTQRCRCNNCKKSFRLTYRYRASEQGIKEKIIDVRDIGRVLGINKNTVVSVLKKTLKTNPYFLTKAENESLERLDIEIRCSIKMDEFWSYVGSKANQRWTWYPIDRKSGCILAWHNGKRRDKDFWVLWKQLQVFDITTFHTDDWGSYSKYSPTHQHRIGKDNTWKIERKNLNFRTHIKRFNRKTICFSKNETIHDNIIGMYIEVFYYKTGTYGNN